MSNPYQRAAKRRKLIYLCSIVSLLGVTVFVRGMVAMPISQVQEKTGKWTIQAQSNRLDLDEMSQGDVELTRSAVRLLLTGSRGVAVCGLWIAAYEKQKRQEWNSMELIVKSIMKLQPHFTVPWLFQSWNLTYNVSVEMDRLSDKYFYISRGINLLAEGETINKNNPDIRRAVAFYYQNKFTYHDQVTTLRCLFELSCMPREDRDYRHFLLGGQLNMPVFQAFCEKNPQLVRRLRETLVRYGKTAEGADQTLYLAQTPQEVVKFLRENEAVPSRYRDDAPKQLEERLRQFPVLPPPFYRGAEEELNPERAIGDGTASAVRAARVWFRYANEVIPPPNADGYTDRNYRDPERKRRMPKGGPSLMIFRQGPQRAQSFLAEQLAKDGWLDGDPWIVDEHRIGDARWFKDDVRIKPTDMAQQQWALAHRMWDEHGRENGLTRDPANLIDLNQRAEPYARKHGLPVGSPQLPPPRADELQDPLLADSIRANHILMVYNSNQRDTNFKFFLHQAEFEMADKTIACRKLFHQADQERRRDQIGAAIALYEQALGTQKKPGPWGDLLFRMHRDAARSERLVDQIAQETYEQQLHYLELLRKQNWLELQKAVLALFDVGGAGGRVSIPGATFALGDLLLQDKLTVLQQVKPLWPPGPFDGVDPDGQPWISDDNVKRARLNLGLKDEPARKGLPSSRKK